MIGEIISYTGSTVPNGYLVCDGSAVSRTGYSALFSVIGTTYGSGDGNTTFNIPNLIDSVSIGSGNSHALGSSGGNNEITLDSSEIPSHSHEIPLHGHSSSITATLPALAHSITQASFTYTRLNATAKVGEPADKSSYSSRNTGTMTRSTNFAVADHPPTACTMSGAITDCAAMNSSSTGSGTAHNNLMPYLALTYLICASE